MSNYKELYDVRINYPDNTELSQQLDNEENALNFLNEHLTDKPYEYATIDCHIFNGEIEVDYKDICEIFIEHYYIPHKDITVIFRERTDKGCFTSTEIIGFYYGKPEYSETVKYIGKLKAEY